MIDAFYSTQSFKDYANSQLNSVEGPSQFFSRHGTIEKIKIFSEKFPFNNEPDSRYAYITYADALGAFRCHKSRKEYHGIEISPASTWKQPDFIENNHQEGESVLKELNDNGLLHIFVFCDLYTLTIFSKVSE